MPYKDAEKQREAQRRSAAKANKRQSNEIRDIGDIPAIKNKRRRNRCRENLKSFLKGYFPEMFSLPWSASHLHLINEIQDKILHGGMKAVAMPRGSGKSTICFGAIEWAVCYGHRKYIYLIAADQSEAESALRTIRLHWTTNDRLAGDFPEISVPVRALEGSHLKARMQTYKGALTHILWGSDEVNFPVLNGFKYTDENSGIVLNTSGISGNIRGANHYHPGTGGIVRPDFVLLDDVQTDKVASSPASCDKMVDLIDGAIKGLAGPGELMSGVMPCTVIHSGDVSDVYLDQTLKPEWHGMRCSMVSSWPKGITDEEISDETDVSKLWLEYSRLRVQSLSDNKDISLATEFYRKNRRKMDTGFTIDWKHRFNSDVKFAGNIELSAIQHAMELRFSNIFTFNSEFQNKPKKSIGGVSTLPTAEQVCERVTKYEPNVLPMYATNLVGMIDIQDETLWYMMMGVGMDFSSIVTSYGSWPKLPYRYFTKGQIAKWKRMSHAFYKSHPDFPRDFSLKKDRMKQAPFEAKIYFALESLCNILLHDTTYRFENGTEVQPKLIAIDVRWGQAAEVAKRFIREYGDSRVLPYEGIYVGATSRQMSDFTRKDGSIHEDAFHRGINVDRWIAKPEPAGGRKVLSDVNRWKTFLMSRLASPVGAPGALVLHDAHPSEHEMLSHHLVKSERPETVTARGRTLVEWSVIPSSGVDNDLLDCASGCCCMASMLGCRIQDDFTSARGESTAIATKKGGEPGKTKVHEKTRKKRVKVSEVMAKRKQSRSSGVVHPSLR